MKIAVSILASMLLLAALLPAQGASPARQPNVRRNSQTTGANDTAVTTSIAAISGQAVHLYLVTARCAAGTASLTVKDGVGGTTIWSTPAGAVGTANFTQSFPVPIASVNGNGMDVVLGTCGVGNAGTLIVQASQL